MDPQIRYRRLRNVSLASIAANCILALAKTAAGLWAGSDAVVSDGVHSLSDVLTTVLVMAGLKLSSEARDDAHPYGHQRFESIVSFIMGGALALIAL
jgi:cation diffusion facilitator family transporter